METEHRLIIGKPYKSKFDSRNDIYTLNAVFGQWADMENKQTLQPRWININNLIPHERKEIKSYLPNSKGR